ncbi:unnamed protein product [Mytilus edulis]|uniref:C2H2-type domain-containing protein n=1 Tax=Mytilus edulis TaxID=6550 RepID=A0A8S3V6Q8_MYTED|nr:unnamed protein product [Mytilus edulis]
MYLLIWLFLVGKVKSSTTSSNDTAEESYELISEDLLRMHSSSDVSYHSLWNRFGFNGHDTDNNRRREIIDDWNELKPLTVDMYICNECSKSYKTRKGLQNHACNICQLCRKTFPSAQKLKRHNCKQQILNKEMLKCQLCKKEYSTENRLRSHKCSYCQMCSILFSTYQKCSNHICQHARQTLNTENETKDEVKHNTPKSDEVQNNTQKTNEVKNNTQRTDEVTLERKIKRILQLHQTAYKQIKKVCFSNYKQHQAVRTKTFSQEKQT